MYTSHIYTTAVYLSNINNIVYIESKIAQQSSTLIRAAVFGQIIFGQSIFGYGVQYGSNLISSQISMNKSIISGISSNIELTSRMEVS